MGMALPALKRGRSSRAIVATGHRSPLAPVFGEGQTAEKLATGNFFLVYSWRAIHGFP